jgi:hypothetical protein
MSENLVCCPVNNLKIDIDFNRIRKIFYRLREKLDNKEFKIDYEPAYGCSRGSIGQHGAICVDRSKNTVAGHDLYAWSGEFLAYVLPESIKELARQSLEAKLNFTSFYYFEHYGELFKHFDGIPDYTWAEQPYENESKKCCNLTFIITSTDPQAYSYAIDKESGKQEIYHSIPGSINLIDPSTDHGVINSGFREIFQMRWLSPVSDVKNFLASKNLL